MNACFSLCSCLSCLADVKNVFNNLFNCTCLERREKKASQSIENKHIKSPLKDIPLLVLRRSLCKNAFWDYRKSIVIYMTLILLDDVKVDKFDCKKYKDNLYLNYDSGKPLFQTKWVTLKRYCIPSKKYLASDA